MNEETLKALSLAEGLEPTAKSLEKVAAIATVEAARWAFLQWDLRNRAHRKFDRAREMLFDRDGLEMASALAVARYHASRFPCGELVVDMTAGIGSDTIALAERGPVTGFDLDRDRVSYTNWNVGVYGFEAEVKVGDSMTATGTRFAFCDPARRSEGRRTLRLEDFSPNPLQVAEIFKSVELGGMKLSPMVPDVELVKFGGQLEFVSYESECREAIVWFGGSGGRRAVHVESGATLDANEYGTYGSPGKYLAEADPAAIRAHCLGTLCQDFGLTLLGDSNGYLTGDKVTLSPWMRWFEVLASLKGDLRETKVEMKRLGGGTPIVKSRAKVDVDRMRRELKGEGEELVLMIYSEGKSIRHLIVRPVAS